MCSPSRRATSLAALRDVAELLKQYYAAVGVDIIIDTVDNQVLTDRINDNSVEAAIFTAEGGFGITAINSCATSS
ncbi:MAG: hypothetical protein U0521_29820 [Anaerolineae bacterium]